MSLAISHQLTITGTPDDSGALPKQTGRHQSPKRVSDAVTQPGRESGIRINRRLRVGSDVEVTLKPWVSEMSHRGRIYRPAVGVTNEKSLAAQPSHSLFGRAANSTTVLFDTGTTRLTRDKFMC